VAYWPGHPVERELVFSQERLAILALPSSSLKLTKPFVDILYLLKCNIITCIKTIT